MPLQKEQSYEVEINGSLFECRVNLSLISSLKRLMTGTSIHDSEIDNMPIPKKPYWLALCVWTIRIYRQQVSPYLGNRCVFEPSCSRYTELALRKYGLTKGMRLSIDRLRRCKFGNGGVDLP